MTIYESHLQPMVERTCQALKETKQMQKLLQGTLPLEQFQWQIRQNYRYLLEYARAWAIGLTKASDFDQMQVWFTFLKATFEDTIMHNRTFWAQELRLSVDDLDQTVMAETKRSYTSHELARAFEGDRATTLMALMPCTVLYRQLGEDLLPLCRLPEDNRYHQWLAYYTRPAYIAKCQQQIELINCWCAGKSQDELKALLEVFAISCNYELLQWRDMYDKMQTWPLETLFPQ